VNPQTKYKDEIIKELQDIPDEDMPKLLEIVHYLKTGMKESRKKVRVKKSKDPLFDLRKIAVETINALRNGDGITSPSRRIDLGQICSISNHKS
jgi:Ribonuclease G/E